MSAAGGAGRRPLLPLALVGAAVLALTAATPFLAPPLHPRLGDLPMVLQALLAGALALLAAPLAARGDPRRALLLVLLVAALLRLALLPHPPALSIDVYRYVWDGRVAGAGLDPYAHVPASPALAPLRDAATYPNVDKKDYATALYPPAAQLFFLGVTRLADGQLPMRVAMVAMEGLGLWALIGLLARLGRPATDAVAVAWHPLAVWEVAGNGHLDGAMTALALAGLLVALRGRVLTGGAIVALGALFKPFALLALPALWRPAWRGPAWRLPLVVALVIAAFYAPVLARSGAGAFGFVATYLAEERLGGGGALWPVVALRALLGPAAGLAAPLYYGAAALLIAGLALRAGFRRERSDAAVLAGAGALVVAFLLLLQPRYPWYFLLALPFALLAGPVARAAAAGASVAAFALYAVLLPLGPGGALAETSLEVRQGTFNVVVIVAIMIGLWRRRTAGRAAPAPAPTRTPA